MRSSFASALILSIALMGCDDTLDESQPVPQFSYSCTDFVCTFDASATTGSRSGAIYYDWDFGDESTGSGKITTHPYSASGTMKVVLTASNSGGVASITKDVPVQGNSAAKYYFAIRDNFGVLLLMEDVVGAIHATGDALQEAVEFHGSASSNYSLDCTAGGTARIVSWTDTDNSLQIDGTEALEFEADKCTFTDAGDALTSTGVVRLSGDFDSTSFSIGKSGTGTSRFQVAKASRWPVQGLINVTATRSGGAIETIRYQSADLRTYRVSTSGTASLAASTPLDITSAFDSTTDIDGELVIDLPTGTTTHETEILSPIDIVSVANNLRLQTGAMSIRTSGDRIDITPDADPDYLAIKVDAGDDGDIDIDTRFPQSVVVERLPN